MTTLREEINFLNLMLNGTRINIESVTSNKNRYLIKDYNNYGVAIQNPNNIAINESFMSVTLKNEFFKDDKGNIENTLYLFCDSKLHIDKFIFLAENFLTIDNEEIIINDPLKWVNEWKTLLGDSIKKKMAYDVIGELIVLNEIIKKDKTVYWQASNKGVHDIETPNYCCEVKSTINRTNTIINISSSFQLHSSKDEYLYFVRLEKDPTGEYSINSITETLINNGYDANELRFQLDELNYPEGASICNDSYSLLEIRKYAVTKENFPVFEIEEINALAPKSNIIGYNLKLDLSSIDYEKIY